MNPTPKTKQIKETHPVATAAATLETPATVPKSPKRKRIPTVTTTLLGASANTGTPVSQTPASTVVTVTSTTPANGSTTSPASSTSAPTPTSAVAAPPPLVFPPLSAGFVPPTTREYTGFYPSQSALVAAAKAVVDLQNFGDYLAVLGAGVPQADAVLGALQVGIDWNTMRTATETWDTYVRAQYGAAWKEATTLLDQVKPAFLVAVAQNPSLALKYSGLAGMFHAPKQAATKAVATKKRKAKAKVDAAGPATTAASAPSTEPAPTQPKTVTVTV